MESTSTAKTVGDNVGLVCVHTGGGQYAPTHAATYFGICRTACQRAVDILNSSDDLNPENGCAALQAAVAATMVLENSPDTNAGIGSNLTEDGHVEMDASAMDGASKFFGAVGAIPRVKNPVRVASRVLLEQGMGLLPMGRVPPYLVVGERAHEWARKRDLGTVESEEEVIGERAFRHYKSFKEKLEKLLALQAKEGDASDQGAGTASQDASAEQGDGAAHQGDGAASQGDGTADEGGATGQDKPADEEEDEDGPTPPKCLKTFFSEKEDTEGVQDTVGVIVVDKKGNVASTASSGGIVLKQPGRVGQAAAFGGGCWAEQTEKVSVGTSTTGCGEQLVRTLLAKECADQLAECVSRNENDEDMQSRLLNSLTATMTNRFVNAPSLESMPRKLGGLICICLDADQKKGHVLWTHTTESMGLAYQTTTQPHPNAVMSQHSNWLNMAQSGTEEVHSDCVCFNV